MNLYVFVYIVKGKVFVRLASVSISLNIFSLILRNYLETAEIFIEK